MSLPDGILIRRVTDPRDPARAGFVRLYREAFAAAPYHESWTVDEVRGTWATYVPHGLFVAEDADGEVIGFGCVKPLQIGDEPSTSVQYMIDHHDGTLPFDPTSTAHMGDVAVDAMTRGLGIGTALVRARLRWAHDEGFDCRPLMKGRILRGSTVDLGAKSCRCGFRRASTTSLRRIRTTLFFGAWSARSKTFNHETSRDFFV